MPKLLETAAMRFLEQCRGDPDELKELTRLMKAARNCFGTIEAEPDLAETSRERLKELLKGRDEAVRARR